MGNNAAWLFGLCWVVFLCLHVFTARIVGGGCGCVFGLGIKRFSAAVWWWGAFKHTVGFTFNTV